MPLDGLVATRYNRRLAGRSRLGTGAFQLVLGGGIRKRLEFEFDAAAHLTYIQLLLLLLLLLGQKERGPRHYSIRLPVGYRSTDTESGRHRPGDY